jgi:hypothetical protein
VRWRQRDLEADLVAGIVAHRDWKRRAAQRDVEHAVAATCDEQALVRLVERQRDDGRIDRDTREHGRCRHRVAEHGQIEDRDGLHPRRHRRGSRQAFTASAVGSPKP